MKTKTEHMQQKNLVERFGKTFQWFRRQDVAGVDLGKKRVGNKWLYDAVKVSARIKALGEKSKRIENDFYPDCEERNPDCARYYECLEAWALANKKCGCVGCPDYVKEERML